MKLKKVETYEFRFNCRDWECKRVVRLIKKSLHISRCYVHLLLVLTYHYTEFTRSNVHSLVSRLIDENMQTEDTVKSGNLAL